ncbi:MAG: M12 family metallo-peptidase, partial [Gemmatimonadota bacterium]|nr:M12 family metallo-peptidase [Gemmatimonadota bacterium]
MKNPNLRFPSPSVLSACLFVLPYLLYSVVRPKAMRVVCLCVGCFSPFAFYLCLSAFICGCFSSIGHASPQPSNDVHFCLPLNLEEVGTRDSIYAATKHALNLNVGAPRTVRMIYFLPNDRPFRQEVVDSMKVAIRQIQTFYAEQMQAHGHGNKTFRFETDARGEPLVHRVDGQYPDSHYLDNTSATVFEEVEQVFDRDVNIYLTVIDNSINAIGTGGGRLAGGIGGGGRNNGYALVPSGFSFHTAAHELGHAFGLKHDFNDNAYIMSYGGGLRHSLSACNAEFLAVHPYFNPSVEAQETPPPTIKLTSPLRYPAGSRSVSIQLKVSDSEGLHQVLLFVETREPHSAAGGFEVKLCRGLLDAKDAVVEFDYDGVIPSSVLSNLSEPLVHLILVEAVDS